MKPERLSTGTVLAGWQVGGPRLSSRHALWAETHPPDRVLAHSSGIKQSRVAPEVPLQAPVLSSLAAFLEFFSLS